MINRERNRYFPAQHHTELPRDKITGCGFLRHPRRVRNCR
nr:MAG TPA: hypothetical protein [Caudoviricetes sp.]